MKIVVCIKQVPDTNDVRWSKDNNLIREGLISILNPYDVYAIQTAVDIKKQNNAQVILVTMGPNDAKFALREGLWAGADIGYLLSDSAFRGADTIATSKTLAYFVKKIVPDFDLIVTGQFATDGDTAQTPVSLGALLNIPIVSFVNEVELKEDKIVCRSSKDDGEYVYEAKTPVLIAISNYKKEIEKFKINNYIKGQDKEIKILKAADIDADTEQIGIKGSHTVVNRAFKPEIQRCCQFINDENFILEKIKEVK